MSRLPRIWGTARLQCNQVLGSERFKLLRPLEGLRNVTTKHDGTVIGEQAGIALTKRFEGMTGKRLCSVDRIGSAHATRSPPNAATM
jgi:hypothetical protein